MPPGGSGRLRALLESIREDTNKLDDNPLYQEGYDDGVKDAEEKYRKLSTALSAFYNINQES